MPKFNVFIDSRPTRLEIIGAETQEEAKRIAVKRAMETETIIDTKTIKIYPIDENGYIF